MTPRQIVAGYAAAWNEEDEAERRHLLEQVWTESGIYTDPTAYIVGREALIAHIGAFQRQVPEAHFTLLSGPEEHHRFVRFVWRLTVPGRPPHDGMDVGELAEDGSLQRIVGFFSPLPPDQD